MYWTVSVPLPVLHYGVSFGRAYAAQAAKGCNRGGVGVDLLGGLGDTPRIDRRLGPKPQTLGPPGMDEGGAGQNARPNKPCQIAATPRKVISVGPGGIHLLPSPCWLPAEVTLPAYKLVRKLKSSL